MENSSKSGLDQCVDAFERLKAGQPRVIEHMGIAKSKITAGIVSVEAGFDRGYLKKARPSHAPLISMIEAFRKESAGSNDSGRLLVRRAKDKAEKAVSELDEVREQLYRVLSQNIQLVERVRSLEAMLQKAQKVTKFPRN